MEPGSPHHFGCGITSVDVFSASVPLLTAPGTTPGTRVGTPLRNAIDIPDQGYACLADYEARVIALDGSPDALNAPPQRLREDIATSPLFDVERYARHLKYAYHLMWRAQAAANWPQKITVPALGEEVRQA